MLMSKRNSKDGKLSLHPKCCRVRHGTGSWQWYWLGTVQKGNAPHCLMNLHSLLFVAKGRMSSVILADLKAAIHEAFGVD
jgi:hypothetical protein